MGKPIVVFGSFVVDLSLQRAAAAAHDARLIAQPFRHCIALLHQRFKPRFRRRSVAGLRVCRRRFTNVRRADGVYPPVLRAEQRRKRISAQQRAQNQRQPAHPEFLFHRHLNSGIP